MTDFRTKLKNGLSEGVKRGWSSFLWMAKIVLPMSLLITLLQWSGWMNSLDVVMRPLTSLINLPPEAALPLISGMLLNLYAVIAAITVIPFTIEQMTLIAVFTLIAHNLIMEGIIQHRAGINVAKIVFVRIFMATATVLVVSLFLGDTSQAIAVPESLTTQAPFAEVFKEWFMDTVILLAKMFGIIMGIMLTLGCIRSLDWTEYLISFFKPLMRVLGLPGRTAMMFVAAVLFGVFYAGAIIVEETKKEDLTREELERLHIFIGINHAMVEDPTLFAIFGLNFLWMWLPRLVSAIVAVQAYRLIGLAWRKLFQRR
ncbi:nucleoside recognition domain-containing protein [Chloroflexota bacterium]